jgi:multidrug efflux pump subunit AcrB
MSLLIRSSNHVAHKQTVSDRGVHRIESRLCRRVAEENVERTAGRVIVGRQEITARTVGEFDDLEQIRCSFRQVLVMVVALPLTMIINFGFMDRD